jgi:hypothetical protein
MRAAADTINQIKHVASLVSDRASELSVKQSLSRERRA